MFNSSTIFFINSFALVSSASNELVEPLELIAFWIVEISVSLLLFGILSNLDLYNDLTEFK
ncbi:hypothetical protein NW064_02770 [Mycoplasmopsis felis]|uniref:hypothetical protein n=1 Tax=Mycoplasmopsis felis TaxID=33923 RepID=UPI0021AF9701|nr:hypothetical protein [Mycoplasmopsis felis]UWW01285.1 hypothetical protein NW064_02770 [Mycoplasmopsis felis]